jgi:hypothetical protein
MENLFHSQTLWGILIRFALNLISLLILIRILYFNYSKKEKFFFTFFLIGIIVFFICALLKDIGMGLGLGFGLFAIFSILRFRTRNFSVKDMAYIFTTIGISVINSMNMQEVPIFGYFIINTIIIVSVFILEEHLRKNSFSKYSVSYDNLDLLKPGSKSKLIKDLSARTGHNILNVKVRNLDLKKDVAQLDVYFKD